MNPANEFELLELALFEAGKTIAYPPTPPLAASVRARLADPPHRGLFGRTGWPAWPPAWSVGLPRAAVLVLAALLLALGLLVAFPPTREALAELFGLRTVRITIATPTPPAAPSGTGTRPKPSPSPAPSLAPCCVVTLDEARQRARFPIRLPAGAPPSVVYLQSLWDEGQQVVLVFGDPLDPKYTLYVAQEWVYEKIVISEGKEGTIIEETEVDGHRALWLTGAPHILVDRIGEIRIERPVTGNTLAWEDGEVTYRLETTLSKEEAIRLAESLK